LVGPIAPATKAARVLGLEFLDRAAGDLGGGYVQLLGEVLEAVIGLGDDGAVEGVGLDEMGARLEVVEVDLLDRLRFGQDEEVVVPLEVAWRVEETGSPEIGFHQAWLDLLDHRSHRPVENEEALGQELLQEGKGVGDHGKL